MSRSPALVGLDWGTTSLRAYLMGGDGAILERQASAAGILQVGEAGFEGTFERHVGAWLEAAPNLPVILSGMIGSRQGWVEVPYLTCPAAPDAIAGHLHRLPAARGRALAFVPGLLVEGDIPDVMRGEETELVGAIAEQPTAELFVLPGTHSKWVRVAGGRLEEFATYMTGELFGVLKTHSILGRLIEAGAAFDAAAFARGATIGLDDRKTLGGLLHRLFGVRTLPLTGSLPGAGVESYLSGLLIGTEVREALAAAQSERSSGGPVMLVGGSELVGRYEVVLQLAGLATARAAPDAAARGQFTLARLAGLLG